MSATDVGWATPGGVKDNKEENDALAWKAWPLQLEQETSADRARATDGRLGSLISRGHSYCRYYMYSMQELFTNS